MAELPGWTRDRLRTASPADVAAARLIVYVRRFDTFLGRDFRSEIAELEAAGLKDPKQIERHERARRGRLREALTQAWKLQAAVRARLGLEPRDDEAPARA